MSSSKRGCFAHAGYHGAEWQSYNLGEGCRYVGIALHELGHVLGMAHEHERFDRDTYIDVNFLNVKDGVSVKGFEVIPWRNDALKKLPYDLSSIMHYPETAFARPGTKTFTVRRKDQWGNCRIGQRQQLSIGDILTVQALYECPEKYCADLSHSCRNSTWSCDGFFGEKMRQDCPARCGVCRCEDVAKDCLRHVNMGLCPHQPNGTKQSKWMTENCQKSCGLCGPSGDSTCVDTGWFCAVSSCSLSFEKSSCARTCGYCAGEMFC